MFCLDKKFFSSTDYTYTLLNSRNNFIKTTFKYDFEKVEKKLKRNSEKLSIEGVTHTFKMPMYCDLVVVSKYLVDFFQEKGFVVVSRENEEDKTVTLKIAPMKLWL